MSPETFSDLSANNISFGLSRLAVSQAISSRFVLDVETPPSHTTGPRLEFINQVIAYLRNPEFSRSRILGASFSEDTNTATQILQESLCISYNLDSPTVFFGFINAIANETSQDSDKPLLIVEGFYHLNEKQQNKLRKYISKLPNVVAVYEENNPLS